jgi:multicomponent Na+:H+ antiporter subunit D
VSALVEYPVLVFFVAAAIIAVAPRRVGSVVMLAAPVVALWQLVALGGSASASVGYFSFELNYLRLDDLSAPFAYVFVVISFLAALYGTATMDTRERVAAIVSAGCGLGVVLAGDLLTLFVMWEMKAVASALLIAGAEGVRRTAAMRYLIIHVLGGSLLLAGIVWQLSTGGGLEFGLFDRSGASNLILLAFLLSAAMPPIHAWLPDAYPSASIAGTVFLSAFTTKSAVYALLRGFSGLEILVYLGVAMAIYGVVYAIIENDIRRLLSYHIVSQVGFMVAAVGVTSETAVNGATAHAFAHILYKGLLMMGAGAVILATGRSRLTDLGGLWRRMPWVFVFTGIGALSIAGVPLLSGFVSKEVAVYAIRDADFELLADGLKLASVGTFLSVVGKLMWFTFGGPDRGLRPARLPATMLVAMGLAAAGNIVIGLRPDVLYDLLPHAVHYEPFGAQRFNDNIQLLGFTALAFVLLIKRVAPTVGYNLDTDWLYRGAPLLVGQRARAARPDDGWTAPLRRVGTAVGDRVGAAWASRVPSVDAPPSTPSTAWLGGVLVAVFLVVLVGSLLA